MSSSDKPPEIPTEKPPTIDVGEWREAISDGKVYYYNTKTKETTWQRPAGYSPSSANTRLRSSTSNANAVTSPVLVRKRSTTDIHAQAQILASLEAEKTETNTEPPKESKKLLNPITI